MSDDGSSKIIKELSTILFQMTDADPILRDAIRQKKLLDRNDLKIPKEKLEKYLSGELEHLDKATILAVLSEVRDILPEKFPITAADGELHISLDEVYYKNENERELDRIYRYKRKKTIV